ncbi:MAG: DUF2341 domain-containing protein [Betaproteobacteria bacterium]|nr:DUF2341 domain-containing protein [Betaproteobacteria bacterium]
MKRLLLIVAVAAALLPAVARAWWNQDWVVRKKITIDPGALQLQAPLTDFPVLVRLHTGNFPFAEADVDGKDLRFIASDDKTPLKYHVELFDGLNELALIWVQAPPIGPGVKPFIWLYYGNTKVASASDPKATYDPSYLAVLHFSARDASFRDSTAYAQPVTVNGVTSVGTGVADGDAAFGPAATLTIPDSQSLALAKDAFTFSAWVKFANATQKAAVLSKHEGAFQLRYEDGQMWIAGSGGESAKVPVAAGAWHHVAVVMSRDRTLLYVDGKEATSAAGDPDAFAGSVQMGPGLVGEVDEVELASVARSPAWIEASVASQGEGSAFTQVSSTEEGGESEGGSSYFRILLGAVTPDGWVVIAILMVMMVISFAVMVSKGLFLSRTDRANKAFQRTFSGVGADLLGLEVPQKGSGRNSSLLRLYSTASGELRKRVEGPGASSVLSAQSIDAIRATLDAGVVRENARLNNQMVLLTIAISGGPFLGLLGTVVGVMITFAAIAAVGDVNVNSIAPGIAAALVATVAGLGVAIPALFGYNYLASRIKNISADMQVFVDELVSRIAERYAP